jgi:hypothetical protein
MSYDIQCCPLYAKPTATRCARAQAKSTYGRMPSKLCSVPVSVLATASASCRSLPLVHAHTPPPRPIHTHRFFSVSLMSVRSSLAARAHRHTCPLSPSPCLPPAINISLLTLAKLSLWEGSATCLCACVCVKKALWPCFFVAAHPYQTVASHPHQPSLRSLPGLGHRLVPFSSRPRAGDICAGGPG